MKSTLTKRKKMLLTVVIILGLALMTAYMFFWVHVFNSCGCSTCIEVSVDAVSCLCQPGPGRPAVTYAEFPFTVLYEVDGEKQTYDGALVCEYGGMGISMIDMKKHRSWELAYIDGVEDIVIKAIDENTFVCLNVGYDTEFLMGDTDEWTGTNSVNCYIIQMDVDGDYRHVRHTQDEIYKLYGVRILDYEIAPAIENSFGLSFGSDSTPNEFSGLTYVDAQGIKYKVNIFKGEAYVVDCDIDAQSAEIKSSILGCPVIAIGDYAFERCHKLESVTLPDGITSIGENAFAYCVSLASINLPDSITSIDKGAFLCCSDLTTIALPSGLMSIEEQTFCRCYNLVDVTLPDNLESIGRRAFMHCCNLVELYVPDSVTAIGVNAFKGCTANLSLAKLPGYYGYQVDPGIDFDIRSE